LATTFAVLSATTARKNQKLRSRLKIAEDIHEQTANQNGNDVVAADKEKQSGIGSSASSSREFGSRPCGKSQSIRFI